MVKLRKSGPLITSEVILNFMKIFSVNNVSIHDLKKSKPLPKCARKNLTETP